ncbi:nucleoside-diphosphate sugar epimerase [Marinobacter sp. Z-F4-2]|nr:nucleoside-diphosphate sugar epimerase [Marinobacter sp. Z-F4-2]
MNILLTGATGFVGRRLLDRLSQRSAYNLTVAVRSRLPGISAHSVLIGSLDSTTDWFSAVENKEVVIHAAARAHVMKEEVSDPLAEYRRINVEGTLNLAAQAAAAGVRRFVYISSVKVNGEQTELNRPFNENDAADPHDQYGLSKNEAEEGLRRISEDQGMELVIVRPPLVYGPGVKGNFATIVGLVAKGVPLPLGSVNNKRSLVSLDNLVDFIVTCMDHPAAANQLFFVSDGQDISTTELLLSVGQAMGKPARLIPVPAGMLMFGATLLGKKAVAQRLLGSLQVDISKARDVLGWVPPLSVKEGLRRCFVTESSW